MQHLQENGGWVKYKRIIANCARAPVLRSLSDTNVTLSKVRWAMKSGEVVVDKFKRTPGQ